MEAGLIKDERKALVPQEMAEKKRVMPLEIQGETATLYAWLNQLRSETDNIVKVENPVEYKFEEITQSLALRWRGRFTPAILFGRIDPFGKPFGLPAL
ncbi:MAG: hypothetical protein A2Z51_05445 [Deltaproteobacteria bacterium RBG_19FT_COMBO_52_11]|jgi:hypothetical protein|nr:MAG: hypothetical protein A2Z51_05445 [Deltaproteobacteria bacterium RBG_19FT_COMBO_52_11]